MNRTRLHQQRLEITPQVGNSQAVKAPGANELPPSARQSAGSPAVRLAAKGNAGRFRWLKRGLAAMAAAALLGGAALMSPAGDETTAPNWSHVQAASAADQPMQWVGAGGTKTATDRVPLSDEDADAPTTAAIRQALLAGDTALADQRFREAQRIEPAPPTALPDAADAHAATASPAPSALEPIEATLTTGMREEIRRGDARFFHIHLYDSCWDDGDVVEILLNGQPTFLVPISNSGATLSVPVSTTGVTVVAVRGVYDGGGGITVACRTSRGDGFVRVMAPGEVQPLGVAQP